MLIHSLSYAEQNIKELWCLLQRPHGTTMTSTPGRTYFLWRRRMLEVFVIFDQNQFLQNICSSGTCLSIDHENQLIVLSFSVFNQECEQDFKYLNKHCTISLPKGALKIYNIVKNMFMDNFLFIRRE